MEVESPATLKHLTKARQRNELLSEKLSSQNERCKQLEEHIRKSDEYSCNLQHKVTEATEVRLNWFVMYFHLSYLLLSKPTVIHTRRGRLKPFIHDLCFYKHIFIVLQQFMNISQAATSWI